jgi:NTP pyrophosphatase (non-canonical NTP hydrolase)
MTPIWQNRAWSNHQRYIKQAQAKGSLHSEAEIINYLTLAICGEAGELANLIKKVWRGDKIDKQEIRDEIADIRIYLEHLAHHLDIEIDRACESKVDIVAERIAAKEREAGRTLSQ